MNPSWKRVLLARDPKRPTASYYIDEIFDDFTEFHGDRTYADDGAIIGGIGLLNGIPVTIIGQEKGQTTEEKIARNFGSPHPEGYRKSLRLMKQAEKFGRPIICIGDTQGAFSGIGAEERGQGRAIAENLLEMSRFTVPIISVLIGEGGSGGVLAVAVADKVAMLENAVYSVISPEGLAAILWRDGARAEEASAVMKMTAKEVHAMGIVDDVVGEPGGGAHTHPAKTVKALKQYLSDNLAVLRHLPTDILLKNRYERFRKIGNLET